jgi:GNAT superfamily N-acetyltransferase
MTDDPLRLIAVADALPNGFETLRAEALAEGRGFIEKLSADWISGSARFDREGEALLAARVNGVLAGIGGITIEPVVPNCLRMRRFYVRPSFRREGIGRQLATELLGRALRSGRSITVNAADGSVRFWESLSFRPDARSGFTHFLENPVDGP